VRVENTGLTIDLRELPRQGPEAAPLHCLAQPGRYVPDSPGGQSDTPSNFGVITMVPRLNPGAMAPDFTVTNLDGKTVKLSDFKGKYVLLEFLAVSNAPLWPKCRA